MHQPLKSSSEALCNEHAGSYQALTRSIKAMQLLLLQLFMKTITEVACYCQLSFCQRKLCLIRSRITWLVARIYLYIVFSVHTEVLTSRTQGKGIEEKEKCHQTLGRGSQADSISSCEANTTATLTLGPLHFALFKWKKTQPPIFYKKAHSCPSKQGHPFHWSLTLGRRKEIRADTASG